MVMCWVFGLYRRAKVLSILDLDVPPTVAVEEARLGTMEEVVECVKSADVLKPALEAAQELLQVISEGSSKEDISRYRQDPVCCKISLLVCQFDKGQQCCVMSYDQVACGLYLHCSVLYCTMAPGESHCGESSQF